jgi:hypothetical protein
MKDTLSPVGDIPKDFEISKEDLVTKMSTLQISQPADVTVGHLLRIIHEELGVSRDAMADKSRKRELIGARTIYTIIMMVLYHDMPIGAIARFGSINRNKAHNAEKIHKSHIDSAPIYRAYLNKILIKLMEALPK